MSTKIKAGTGSSGAVIDADTTGILELQSGSTPTTAVTIDASQNVGLGGTPVSYGSAYKVLTINGSTTGVIDVQANGTTQLELSTGTNIASIAAPQASGVLAFSAGGNTERMRIDSSGNLLVGMTTALGAGINSSSNYWTGTAGSFWKTTNFSATYYFGYNSVDKATINGSTGAYTALSDVNKKKDFEPSTLGLNAVMQLKPTLFRMLEDEETSEKYLGFIAQDVQNVIPQAYVEQDGPDGKFIGLQDRPIIAVLTKAIQELNAKVEALEAQLGAK